MKTAIRLSSLALLGLAFLGMAQRQEITVRFYAEANARDSPTFSAPATFKNPPRNGFVEKLPVLSEHSIKAIFPFQARDGTWGCAFKLDEKGRLDLETASTYRRGSSMVAVVGTKSGNHQVVDMIIDRAITDGIISIPSGLTEAEIAHLTKTFPILGQKRKK